jgi:hypothetical protein
MKSKYCFIRNLPNIDVGSFIYHVWVGSSLRELTLLSKVEEQCKSKGFYLRRWTCLVHSRIEKISARFVKNGYAIACPFRYASITLSELSSMILDNSFDSFESSIEMTAAEKWYRYHHNIEFIKSQNKISVLQNAYPRRRKYLSPSF